MRAGSVVLWDFSFNRPDDCSFLERVECAAKDPGVTKKHHKIKQPMVCGILGWKGII